MKPQDKIYLAPPIILLAPIAFQVLPTTTGLKPVTPGVEQIAPGLKGNATGVEQVAPGLKANAFGVEQLVFLIAHPINVDATEVFIAAKALQKVYFAKMPFFRRPESAPTYFVRRRGFSRTLFSRS